MKRTKLYAIAGIALAIIISIAVWQYYGPKAEANLDSEKQTVKIGVILPLTGPIANMGQSAQEAVLLAQKNLDKTKFNYQIIFEDDALDGKLTSNAANKLINVDKVDALVSFSSGSGNVVSPMAQTNKVLHISIATDPNIAKGEYNFIHWTTPAEENRIWINEAIKRGIKKVAVVQMNQQGYLAMLEDMKAQIKGKDIEIVNTQIINSGDRDFKVVIEKSFQNNPDVIFVGMLSPELELFTKQYKELGKNAPITTLESFEFSEQTDLFEGYWYAQGAQALDKFTNDYNSKYSGQPQLGAPFIYDAVNLIVAAYENSGEINNEKAIAELSEIKDFPSTVGTISVGNEGIVWSQAVIREIRDGKPVTIK